MMDSERWEHVKTLFHEALDRTSADRSTFLRDACGDDASLRSEVESLLVAHERADGAPLTSPFDAFGTSGVAALANVLQSGNRLGPYIIVSPLGAGGMGEVYRARDTRLNRTVAVKVLSAVTADDPEFRARFTREGQAIAALTHPHICTVYDVGRWRPPGTSSPTLDFLVMEHLDGETLAARLTRGALPLDTALTIAIQIVDALDAAHRAGILHRDLKPANVMLVGSRRARRVSVDAKLLDFGLAKVMTAAPDPARDDNSTFNGGLSGVHAVLGTLPYMAPEQLAGKPADARSDIFAFGALFYEMVCGRAAFQAASRKLLVDEIRHRDPPPLEQRQPAVPPFVAHIIARCLAKDPGERWQTTRDLAAELQWNGTLRERSAPTVKSQIHPIPQLAVMCSLMLAAAGIGWWLHRPAAETTPTPVARFSVALPEATALVQNEAPAVSPDGRYTAFVASSHSGPPELRVRSLDGLSTRILAGTAGAARPFWSPDSEWIGFFADGQLKRISATGGVPQMVCQIGPNFSFGAAWSADGTIIFSPNEESGLFSVPAAGGPMVRLTTIDVANREHGHYWPHFLPDGEHFLFTVDYSAPEQDGIYIGSLGSKERRLLLHGLSNVSYMEPGYLLFTRDRAVMAQRFDAGTLQLMDHPRVMAEGVTPEHCCGTRLLYSASVTGVLAYRTDESTKLYQLTWLMRDGTRYATLGQAGRWANPSLSPGETTVAVTRRDNQLGDDLWLFDVARGSGMRFTTEPGWDLGPIWSPDGQQIVFASDRLGPFNLFRKPSTRGGSEQLLFTSPVSTLPNALVLGWQVPGVSIGRPQAGKRSVAVLICRRQTNSARARSVQ